jgi:hypothetical protein
MAVLSEELIRSTAPIEPNQWAFDIEFFQPGGPFDFVAQRNGVVYPAGGTWTPQPMTAFRETNHFALRFAYRFYGANCTTSDWPTEAGNYATPTLVPISTIAF